METNRRKHGVMNNVTDIEKRASEVSPMSLFGASAMGFPDKISTVRGVMMTRHTSQRVVVRNPEFSRLYTGAENIFGDRSSWNIKAKHDYQLLRTFVKFPNAPMSPIAYIFKDLETGKYLCEVVKPAHNLVEKYGFRMTNKISGKYHDGDRLPQGTTISQSSSYVNDNYCAGCDLRMAYAVLPELTEDALIISDVAAKRLEYDMVDIVSVKLKKNAFLLNKYGTAELYKPFPDVGEEIKRGVLCAIRENSYISSASEASISHINDTRYCTHGIVVDIDIYSNIDVDNDQFNYYATQIRNWYSDIYSYISTILADESQADPSLLDIYTEAQKYLNTSTWVTKEYIEDTVIRFTILQPKKINIGQKVVGRYGNKSVIAKIIPQHLMPRTDDGRPIDMIANGLAVPNRIIAFATYEASATFQMERMYQHILEMDRMGYAKMDIIELVVEFVKQFNENQASEIMRLALDDLNTVYQDIIRNGIYIQIPPLNEICVRDALISVYEKWPDIMKPYKIQTKLRHRWVTLDGEYNVGYQYTWVLKQEPSKAMSSTATGRTTLYDLPVKTRQYNKHLRPYSDNPVKFGEYDTYNFAAGVSIKALAKITTYFRGSQYEENSVLMSQLNNVGIDTSKYNKFPQLDNLKNILKLLGTKLKPDIIGVNTIGNIDEIHEILFSNTKVNISIPDLHYILIMHSYYLQYEEYKNGMVDMQDFLGNMLQTNVFTEKSDEYVNHIFEEFVSLLPTLQQLKQYD